MLPCLTYNSARQPLSKLQCCRACWCRRLASVARPSLCLPHTAAAKRLSSGFRAIAMAMLVCACAPRMRCCTQSEATSQPWQLSVLQAHACPQRVRAQLVRPQRVRAPVDHRLLAHASPARCLLRIYMSSALLLWLRRSGCATCACSRTWITARRR